MVSFSAQDRCATFVPEQLRMNTQTTAVHDFAPYFNSVRVDRSDTATMRAVHRLRYEVYCLECSFLPALLYADQLESDRHDAEAVHFAAFNRTGELVGYVRLVRPNAQQRLPFQDH